ncbi:hypothetical protein BP6252_11729 [Coleophoma cylindrospora]|uniref:Putative zinc-finger domain-containing protein n=1 Tax=Coleophoma cylindrospora TaxID=1849047 RepID=A0A3D8QKE6_9HELO|nr:hypothetical protein BP6252_11729 [Coleophoma cylindrospora]
MADYPQTPHYGSHFGHQSQSPYVPPTYPNQYMQSTTHQIPGNYAYPVAQSMENTQSAYNYNQNIPGTATAPGLNHQQPIYQGWNQEPMPSAPYTPQQPNLQNPSYGPSYYGQQNYQLPPQAQQQYSQYPAPGEDGELSEGEFEPRAAHTGPLPSAYDQAPTWNSDRTGFVDTAHRAVFPRNQERSTPQSARSGNAYNYGTNSPRLASDSYSPYTSPQEIDYEAQYSPSHPGLSIIPRENGAAARVGKSPPDSTSKHFKNNAQKKHPRVKGTPESLKSTVSINGHHPPHIVGSAQVGSKAIDTPPIETTSTIARGEASSEVLQARKAARDAITDLSAKHIPLQVYVNEGFDNILIEKYFDELGVSKFFTELDITSFYKDAASKAAATPPNHNGAGQASNTASTSGQNGTPSAATVPSPTAAKSAVATEKEKLLQKKMEALRKSREERAQKAAAKSTAVPPKPIEAAEKAKDMPVEKPFTPVSLPQSPIQQEAKVMDLQPAMAAKSQQDLPNASFTNIPLTLPAKPPAPAITQPQPGQVIPGLFLTSSTNNSQQPTASTNPHPTQPQPFLRKRPVAADFDGPPVVPQKRPFGHSRNDQPLVIDVSEDEESDEDVAMELDSQNDPDSPVQSSKILSDLRAVAGHSLPALSDLPPRRAFTTPPSASGTPPTQVPLQRSILGGPDLQQKMREIDEMKKKIADAEARKKAKQNSSGANTPRRPETTASEGTIGSQQNNLTGKVEAAIKIDSLVASAEAKTNKDYQKLADTQIAQDAKADELQNSEAEQKRLRRQKLLNDLPLVDAEVQNKQNQLQQLQAQMAQIQAAIQKDLDEKQRMVEERERLGREAEEQLQAQKAKLEDLESEEQQNSPGMCYTIQAPEVARPIHNIPMSPNPVTAQKTHCLASPAPQQNQVIEHASTEVHSSTEQESEPQTQISKAIQSPDVPAFETTSTDSSPSAMEVDSDESRDLAVVGNEKSSESIEVTPSQVATPDGFLEAALQDAVRAENESSEVEERQAVTIETDEKAGIDTSFSPKPDQVELGSSEEKTVEDLARSPIASPVLSRKPLQVGEGESDDYEPPEATRDAETHDGYELPKPSPPIDTNSLPAHSPSPPFSPAPPQSISQPGIQGDLESVSGNFLSLGNNEQDTAEDSVLLRNQSLRQATAENTDIENNETSESFRPYESPLRIFRSYRFHPEFKDAIPGGYKSMTYSHKFDPNKELCRYELAGGFCNDPDCDLQHFKNVALSDNDILASLASHTEFSGEQRGKFVSGLKEIFASLREKNLDKDFESIASALVAHRAQFLGDKSKVLMLEGTST